MIIDYAPAPDYKLIARHNTETMRLEFVDARRYSHGMWFQGVLGPEFLETRLSQEGVVQLCQRDCVQLDRAQKVGANDYRVTYFQSPASPTVGKVPAVDFFIPVLGGRAKRRIAQVRPDGTLQFLGDFTAVNGDALIGQPKPQWTWHEDHVGDTKLRRMIMKPGRYRIETVVRRGHDNYQVCYQEKQ